MRLRERGSLSNTSASVYFDASGYYTVKTNSARPRCGERDDELIAGRGSER